jgi:hypothetical protein
MPTYPTARIPQLPNAVIVLVDQNFVLGSAADPIRAMVELSQLTAQAGLRATLTIAVWEDESGQMVHYAPPETHAVLRTAGLAGIRSHINGDLTIHEGPPPSATWAPR